jgi:hypothetical protein
MFLVEVLRSIVRNLDVKIYAADLGLRMSSGCSQDDIQAVRAYSKRTIGLENNKVLHNKDEAWNYNHGARQVLPWSASIDG